MVTATSSIRTLADLMKRLGDVPLDRIRFHPFPGSATVADVVRIQEQEGRLCELVVGVLLEKTVGLKESLLAGWLLTLLNAFVRPKNLGIVTPPDGTLQLVTGLVRIPDVAFLKWDRFVDRRLPDDPVPLVVPNLAVEVLSTSNTRTEMAIKRTDYFQTGVELVWEIDPRRRTVTVYTSLTDSTTLDINDTLDGGSVLPGFQLPLTELFGELDRQG
jgi:Uma2 family endonuclease